MFSVSDPHYFQLKNCLQTSTLKMRIHLQPFPLVPITIKLRFSLTVLIKKMQFGTYLPFCGLHSTSQTSLGCVDPCGSMGEDEPMLEMPTSTVSPLESECHQSTDNLKLDDFLTSSPSLLLKLRVFYSLLLLLPKLCKALLYSNPSLSPAVASSFPTP